MANEDSKIVQEVELRGAGQINRDLDSIAKKGEEAFGRLKEAGDKVSQIQVPTDQIKQNVDSLRNSGQTLVTQFRDVQTAGVNAAEGIGSSFSAATKVVLVSVGVIAGAVAVVKATLSSLANDAAERVGKVADVAEKLKIEPEALQSIRSQVDDTNELDSALTKLRENLDLSGNTMHQFGDSTVQVVRGFQNAQGELKQFGLALAFADPTNLIDQAFVIAQAIGRMTDGLKQAKAGAELFGPEWQKVIELASQGREAFFQAAEGSRIFSNAEVETAKTLRDANNELNKSITFTKDRIGLLFAPIATTRAVWLTQLIDGVRDLVFEFIQADDQKKKLFEGGRFDFFKDFDLNKFSSFLEDKGWDNFASAVRRVHTFTQGLGVLWDNIVIPAADRLSEVLDALAERINSTFGTELSGRFLGIAAAVTALVAAFSPMTAVLGVVAAIIVPLLASFSRGGEVFTRFREALRGIGIDIDALSETAGRFLGSVWRDFLLLLSGRGGEVTNEWLKDIIQAIKELATSTPAAITGLAGLILILNRTFGPANVVRGVLLGMSGILTPLRDGIAAIAFSFVGLNAALNIGGTALAAIAALFGITARAAFLWVGAIVVAAVLIVSNLDKVFTACKVVADALNEVFGTHFTPTTIIQAIGVVAGAFLTLVVVMRTVGVASVATGLVMARALLPLLVVLGLVAGAYQLIQKAQERLRQRNGEAQVPKVGDAVKQSAEGLSAVDEGIAKIKELIGSLTGLGDAAQQTGKKVADTISGWFKQVKPGDWSVVGSQIGDSVKAGLDQSSGFKQVKQGVWEQTGKEASKQVQDSFEQTDFSSIGSDFAEAFNRGLRSGIENAEKIDLAQAAGINDIGKNAEESISVLDRVIEKLKFFNTVFEEMKLLPFTFDFSKLTQGETAVQSLMNFFSNLGTSASNTVTGLGQTLSQFLSSLQETISSVTGSIASGVSNVVAQINAEIDALLARLRAVKQEAQSTTSTSQEQAPGFAGGGVVSGPGTGTSDQILSWLSNGEGILTARAVAHYGRGLVHLINSLQLPRFAAGGIVDIMSQPVIPSLTSIAIPAAASGSSGNGRSFTLVLDNRKYPNLTGPTSVLDDLEREASKKQLSSMGQKPSHYK